MSSNIETPCSRDEARSDEGDALSDELHRIERDSTNDEPHKVPQSQEALETAASDEPAMNLSSSQSVQDQLGKKRFRVNILFDEAAAMVGGGYVDPEKPALEQLNKLAAAGTWALQLYDSINSVDRVDSAIAIMKIVVENTPENHPEQSQYLYTLGSAFFQRFGQLGTFSDLEEAIPLQRRAVALVPDTDPSKPKYLNGLGVSLVKRSRHLESLKDVEEALIVHRRAVDLTPRNHHLYPGFSSDIGDAFCAHFELSGEIKALSIAIETQQYALKHLHEKHPDRAIYLHRLCTSLLIRFRHFRDNIDMEEAIDAQYRAVRIIPPGDTFKSILLIDLAHALSTRMKHRPNHSDFNEAFKLFIDEGDHPSRPSLKLDAALQLAELCSTYPEFSSPDMLLRAYTFVFEAIPQVVWLGNGINQRLQSLIRIGSVFNAAAAAAIATGNSGRALEWVEQGRSVVWRQILHLRTPLDDLRRHYPTLDLPDRLEQVSVALENTGGLMRDADLLHDKDNFPQLSLRMTPESETLSDYTQHTHRLATEYEKLLTEVRKLDGFESFLKPKLSRELACAAKSSFVVVINVDKTRCDALVICPDEELIHVPLPELTYEVVKSMQSQLASALQKTSLRNRSRLSISSKSFHHSYDDVERILSGLWQLIVKPILKQIGLLPDPLSRTAPDHLKTSCLPHITWCACGPLSFLPLHAAGDYDPKGERMRVSDLAVSSYTPTLDALLKPRFNISFPDSILVVSQSSTPGYPSLPGVNEEVSKIKGHFLDPPVLEGPNATTDAVFDAMDKCSWIHLACHGVQNVDDATESAFLLHDGPLKVSRLMSKSMHNAELAVLSACQTATGDAKLPDEAIHLAASMLAVGYQSVVGTMWSIGDDDAPVIVDLFYSNLQRLCSEGALEGRSLVAYALHEAVRSLQDKVGEHNILKWAPFVHFGQ